MDQDLKEKAEGISQELLAEFDEGRLIQRDAVVIADLIVELERVEKETAKRCAEIAYCFMDAITREHFKIAVRKEFNLGE